MYDVIKSFFNNLFYDFSNYYVRVLQAKLLELALIAVFALVAYRYRDWIVSKILTTTKFSANKKATLQVVGTKALGIVIIALTIIKTLTIFGVNESSIMAVLGTVTVALGLAAKDLVKDFLTGAILIFEDSIHMDDIITVNEYTGTVKNITIRTLTLNSFDNQLHIIPNGTITSLTNHTREKSCAVVTVGVAYEENIDNVLAVLNDEMDIAFSTREELLEKPVVQGITDFGDSSVDIRIVAQCEVGTHWALERELRRLIKNRLDKENIEIPFPQRVVTMKKED